MRSRGRVSGVHRTEVTKGESEEDEVVLLEVGEVGGGMGRTVTSCIERESTTEIELPEG